MKSYKLIIKPVQELPCSKYHIVYNLKDYFEDVERPTRGEKVRLISDWTDEKPNRIFAANPKDIDAACDAIIKQLNSYKPQKPRDVIKTPNKSKKWYKLKRQTYVFKKDYDKMSYGWWEHVRQLNMKDNPLELIGLVYMEKGMGYSEVDKHDNVLNPVSERQKALVDKMNLADFLDIGAFFLNQYVILKELRSGLNISQTMEELLNQHHT